MSNPTVEIRVIGRLWMPGVLAAWRKEYRVGSGPFETDIKSLSDAEWRMACDSGDLSTIDDYEIVYHVTRHYTRPGIVGRIVHTRSKVARPWKHEGSEFTYQDCTYPPEDCQCA